MSSADPANLFRLEDIEDADKMAPLAARDREALRAIGDWIKTYVVRPHAEIGRPGPVCPFVPRAWESRTLWLAPQRVAGRRTSDMVELIENYKRLFLSMPPTEGEDASLRSLVLVCTDLAPARARVLFADALAEVAAPAYENEGLVMGAFYEGNDGTAIYNPNFRPFTSPVPFLLMRHAVVSDWKFFLDDEAWLNRWARRYGPLAAQALAAELRRHPWRSWRAPDSSASPS